VSRFYLIRHAEKDAPPQQLTARRPGVRLTALGRRQAEAIAAELAGAEIDHIFASPLERAQESAAPLARRKGVPTQTLEALQEFEIGDWTDRMSDGFGDDPTWKHFNTFRSGTRPPGGELMLEVQLRFVREMLALRDEFPEESIALFSHGDPLRAAVCYFAGSPIDFWNRFQIDVGSISEIELTAYAAKIIRLNLVPPLDR
jgi:probable phosphoglycerate mutase